MCDEDKSMKTKQPRRAELISEARRLPNQVRWKDISEFESIDDRVALVNAYFVNLIGMNNGSVEFCSDSIPPTDEEYLAFLWLVRPKLSSKIAKLITHNKLFAQKIVEHD